jgi:CubicO group peptidase (beta-lactamase class C family)
MRFPSFDPRLPVALALAAMLGACATPSPRAAAPIDPADAALAEAADAIAGERAADGRFSGVVVLARGDAVFFARAYGLADREAHRANTTATPFNIASLGKMFTGVAIARLVERGVLDYDAPVGRYLAGLPNADIAQRVTLGQLLTHTSGVPDLPDALFAAPPPTLEGYAPFFAQARLDFAPGTKRSYSNAGFVLLGLVLERATGRSFADVLRAEVFVPTGIDGGFALRDTPQAAIGYTRRQDIDPWRPNTDAIAAHAGPHGGELVSAPDLARFFAALRDGRLLGAGAASDMLRAHGGDAGAYAFGTLDFATDRLVGHSGGDAGASADAYTYWRSGYTIVVLSNLDPPASHEVAKALREQIEPRFRTP